MTQYDHGGLYKVLWELPEEEFDPSKRKYKSFIEEVTFELGVDA